MKKTNNKNHRKAKRHICAVPIETAGATPFNHTYTIDMSRSGMGFVSSKQIPIDQTIGVELNLSPKEDPIYVLGEVKWVEPMNDTHHFRIGMRFADVLDGSQANLNKFFSK